MVMNSVTGSNPVSLSEVHNLSEGASRPAARGASHFPTVRGASRSTCPPVDLVFKENTQRPTQTRVFLIASNPCMARTVQGYLTDKKTHPHRTLPWAYAESSRGVLGGWAYMPRAP